MSFCINCDNRHGCKNGLPECLRHNRDPGEERLRGREFMKRRGWVRQCATCKDFGVCYGPGEYEAALEAGAYRVEDDEKPSPTGLTEDAPADE